MGANISGFEIAEDNVVCNNKLSSALHVKDKTCLQAEGAMHMIQRTEVTKRAVWRRQPHTMHLQFQAIHFKEKGSNNEEGTHC